LSRCYRFWWRFSGKLTLGDRHEPDDGYGVKNARKGSIELDEQGAVCPAQMQSARHALLQDIELMPQHQDFGF
jgi:hypothetical protein